jgi:hypothetical protein
MNHPAAIAARKIFMNALAKCPTETASNETARAALVAAGLEGMSDPDFEALEAVVQAERTRRDA